jgi:hypothetical protein
MENIAKLDEGKLSPKEKLELFRAIATDDNARRAYIASRAMQIEPMIAKESQIRRILTPVTLGAGAQAQFFIGSQEVQTAWIAPGIGSAPRRTVEGDEVWVNTFAIFARGEWLMDLATDGRFDVAQEIQFFVTEQLKEMENLVGWNLLNAALAHAQFPVTQKVQIGSTSGVDLTTGKGFFSKQLLANLILAADIARRRITDIYVSPRTAFDMFTYWTGTTTNGIRTVPEPVQTQIWQQGLPASGDVDSEFVMNIFGINVHKVYTSDVVDDNTVYAFDLSGRRSKLGVMPIRQGVQTYEDPIAITEFKVGYFARMREGFAILDMNNMFKGTIAR